MSIRVYSVWRTHDYDYGHHEICSYTKKEDAQRHIDEGNAMIKKYDVYVHPDKREEHKKEFLKMMNLFDLSDAIDYEHFEYSRYAGHFESPDVRSIHESFEEFIGEENEIYENYKRA